MRAHTLLPLARPAPVPRAGYQVASSTTLQMLLYFNLLYAIVFGVLYQLLAAWKSSIWQAPLVVELVTPMSFWVWAFIEMLRLGLGYFGNLAERVPWLMGFWMLTLFPQPVIQMWFMLVQGLAGWFVLPIEVWLSVGMQVAPASRATLPNPRLDPIAMTPLVLQLIHLQPPNLCTLSVRLQVIHLQPPNLWTLSVRLQVIYLAELVVSYRANKRLVAKAAADFHLQPIDPAYDSADAL